MLRVNQLIGFGAVQAGAALPSVRYTGHYAANFSSSTTATATVPSSDLGPASPTKQILVIARCTAATLSAVSINGVNAPLIAGSSGIQQMFASAVYAGSGPFNVILTVSSSITEAGSIDVYEIDHAAPLYKGCITNDFDTSLTAHVLNHRIAKNSCAIGSIINLTNDTATFTWTGLTEDSDYDAGAYGVSAASVKTNASDRQDVAIMATSSAAISAGGAVLEVKSDDNALSGGFATVTVANALAVSASISRDFTGLGSFKLVVAVGFEGNATITGVTFNGNAMTQIGQVNNTGASPDLTIGIFAIDVTQAAPSGTIQANFSANISIAPVAFAVGRFYNVGSLGIAQSAQGNATGTAVNVDVAENGLIAAFSIRADDTQSISWSGLSNTGEDDFGTFRFGWGIRPYSPAETGRAIQAVGSASGQYATIAAVLNP